MESDNQDNLGEQYESTCRNRQVLDYAYMPLQRWKTLAYWPN